MKIVGQGFQQLEHEHDIRKWKYYHAGGNNK